MKIRLILLSLVGIAAYIMLASFHSKMIKETSTPKDKSQVSMPQTHPVPIPAPEKINEAVPEPQEKMTSAQPAQPVQPLTESKPAVKEPETAVQLQPTTQPQVQFQVAPVHDEPANTEELEKLKTELTRKEDQVRQLLQAQEAIAAQYRALLSRTQAAAADSAAKEAQLKNAREQIQTLTVAKDKMAAEFAEATKALDELRRHYAEAKAAGVKAEQDIKEKETLLQAAQKQVEQRTAESGQYKAQLSETIDQLTAAKSEVEQAGLKIGALAQESQEKEQRTAALEEQKGALEKRLQEKEEALTKAVYTMQSLKQEVAAQPQAVATIQNLLDEKNRELEQVKKETAMQIDQLNKQVAELGAADKQVAQERQAAQAEAEAALKKAAELESAHTLAQTALAEAEKKLAAALESKNTLQNQLNDKEAFTSGAQAQINELTARTTSLNDEKLGLASQLEALRADQKNLLAIKATAEQKAAALAEAEGKLQEMAALRAKNEEMTKTLEEKTAALAAAAKQGEELTALQTKYNEMTVQSEAQSGAIKQLETEKSDLASQLAAVQAKAAEAEALKKSLDEKSQALVMAETNIKDMAKAGEDITRLESELAAAQTAKQAAEQKAADSETALRNQGQTLTANSDKIKTLESELAAAQARVNELMDKTSLKQQLDLVPNLNQQISTLREQISQMEAAAVLTEKKMTEATAAAQVKNEAVQAAQQKAQTLQTEKESLQKSLDANLATISDLQKQLEGLKAQPAAQQTEVKSATVTTVAADKDKDTIADPADLCPDSPAGTPVNALGCPEKKGFILEGVTFKTATATLMPESKKYLDKIAPALALNPQMKIEVAGFTDSAGDPKRNVMLSTQRSQEVVTYLISKGVAAEQLTAKGYGSENPIADNATSAGKQKNRRIELHPLAR